MCGVRRLSFSRYLYRPPRQPARPRPAAPFFIHYPAPPGQRNVLYQVFVYNSSPGAPPAVRVQLISAYYFLLRPLLIPEPVLSYIACSPRNV